MFFAATARCAACLVLLLVSSDAYSSYKSKIPNGNMGGVGHSSCTSTSSCSGGGSRNAFGAAFANAGHQWTSDLCNGDRDGDGKSNGLELGDPAGYAAQTDLAELQQCSFETFGMGRQHPGSNETSCFAAASAQHRHWDSTACQLMGDGQSHQASTKDEHRFRC